MRWWGRWTEPGPSVVEPEARRTARLLASLLLSFLLVSIPALALEDAFVPGFFPVLVTVIPALVALVGAYALSRGRHVRAGGAGAVVVMLTMCLGAGFRAPHPEEAIPYTFLCVVFAGFVLSMRDAWIAAAVAVAGSIVLTVASPRAAVASSVTLIACLVMGCVLVLVGLRHRDRVEQDRRVSTAENEARLRLNDRLVSLGTLTAGVAHEVTTPLTYATMNVETVLGDARAGRFDRAVELLPMAREGLDQISEIVRSLRAFARADETSIGPVDLGEVVKSTVRMVSSSMSGVRVFCEAEAVQPILGNPARVGQVVTNLLLNASQASRGRNGDAEIHVVVAPFGSANVSVTVADNGDGIAPEHLDRIFDPFFTTKDVGEGTGLGLAICHGIVRSMKGDIRVESTKGSGTRFRVSFPVAASAR